MNYARSIDTTPSTRITSSCLIRISSEGRDGTACRVTRGNSLARALTALANRQRLWSVLLGHGDSLIAVYLAED